MNVFSVEFCFLTKRSTRMIHLLNLWAPFLDVDPQCLSATDCWFHIIFSFVAPSTSYRIFGSNTFRVRDVSCAYTSDVISNFSVVFEMILSEMLKAIFLILVKLFIAGCTKFWYAEFWEDVKFNTFDGLLKLFELEIQIIVIKLPKENFYGKDKKMNDWNNIMTVSQNKI